MRPYVPPPTAMKKKRAQVDVMMRPMGETSRRWPGTTNGAADSTAAEALAPASGSTLVGPEAAVAKTPFTNEASPDERVVSTSWPERGLRAERSICGMRSDLRESLLMY
jgi:hypothetical protein